MALASKSAAQLARERCLRLLAVLKGNIEDGKVTGDVVVDAIVIDRLIEVINDSVITRAVEQVFAAHKARLSFIASGPPPRASSNPKPRRRAKKGTK